jgi:protease I
VKAPKKEKKFLIVIPPKEFQDEEYERVRAKLEVAGFAVDVASDTVHVLRGLSGVKVKPDYSLIDLDPSLYLGVIFIGGPGMKVIESNPLCLSLAQTFNYTKKWTLAIKEAVIILVNAGILNGREATGLPADKEDILKGNSVYLDQDFVLDQHIMTLRNIESFENNGNKIMELFLAEKS